MVKKLLLSYTVLSILSISSSATTYNGVFVDDFDRENITPTLQFLKVTCTRYPYLPLCQNWKYLQKKQEKDNNIPEPQTLNNLETPESSPNNTNTQTEEIIDDESFMSRKLPAKRYYLKKTAWKIRKPKGSGYKRGQKFQNWGGKRNENSGQDTIKRNKFTSWGGKRDPEYSDEDIEKRTKFTSWGGKRDPELSEDVEKRSGFRSWGGKRDPEFPDEDIEKRTKFRSWGGKRDPEIPDEDIEKRTKFRSWGGKRDTTYLDDLEKRTKFRSWGGKRDSDLSDQQNTENGVWGGKGYEPIFLIDLDTLEGELKDKIDDVGDDGVDGNNLPDKRGSFRNWGGKKSVNDIEEEIRERNTQFPVFYNGGMEKRASIWKLRAPYYSEPFKKHFPKRPQFQSWGGKRSSHPWLGSLMYYYLPLRPQRYSYSKFINGEEKRKFSSWGGKRNDKEKRFEYLFNTSADKQAKNLKTRQIFQNWGGKRTSSDETSDDKDKESVQDVRDGFSGKSQLENPPPTASDS